MLLTKAIVEHIGKAIPNNEIYPYCIIISKDSPNVPG